MHMLFLQHIKVRTLNLKIKSEKIDKVFFLLLINSNYLYNNLVTLLLHPQLYQHSINVCAISDSFGKLFRG